MKTTYLIGAVISGLILFSTGCRKDHLDKLSKADQEALAGMESAYNNAKAFNDSIVYCSGAGQPCSQEYVEYCDSIFHHYESLWNQHHENYSHDNPHDDHHHDGHGMHQNGSANGHDNEAGHHQSQHDLMILLASQHEPYHP